ncbi:ELM1/GtrOC1 family putative glycosyltransferase [uncultured Salinisphaera sp.]|uniref:ELM1/GtrOC1 family putative glycosyltransferase n=1 Tax=uncultured Salinisphaera sp. TaxID=359372 RepID=UPI0032B1700B
MAVRIKRIAETFWEGDLRHADSGQSTTLMVRLTPRPGLTPSDKPPVRIFLGTEAVQFRAERAFIYSVARVRDPARTYEIHLMKDFKGFERRLWLTGFTNYRFMIPSLAGGTGRAIYNDTDQIYLRDPAELFDAEMGEAGVLSINDRDTSVMLMDCARMIGLWNTDTARRVGNRELEKQMREAGFWADLDDAWNARDAEYVPGESAVVHYTTIHTQPWRPTPQDYVYRDNPAADIWQQIEDEADAAGFQVWDAAHPSPLLAARQARLDSTTDSRPARVPAEAIADFKRLVSDCKAKSARLFSARTAEFPAGALRLAEVSHAGVADLLAETALAPRDVVLAPDLVELPDTDLPWIVDALFAGAQRAVCVSITLDTRATRQTPADAIWWYQLLVAAGRRAPGRHWRLTVRKPRRGRADKVWRWSGGALATAAPTVWAITHYKTGHRSQALGVARALGWSLVDKPMAREPGRYARALAGDWLRPISRRRPGSWPGELTPPWPDVVVASGWLPSLAARAVARRSLGRTRLILMGRRGGRIGESQDVAVVCRHFDLPPNPRQIETVLPPSRVAPSRLSQARADWSDLFGEHEGPNIVWLVGGDTPQHALDAETAARLTRTISAQVQAAGGHLAILNSRRTSREATAAIDRARGPASTLVDWAEHTSGAANPYLGYLAHADRLVVTGESESMLAEAIATGRPVYIAPLPEADPGPRRRLADWVVAQAARDRFNKRGSRRPQEGLQYLCARLVEQRVFVPKRNMPALHAALIDQGVARYLGDALSAFSPPVWHETDWLARRIRALLPLAADGQAAPGRPASAVSLRVG